MANKNIACEGDAGVFCWTLLIIEAEEAVPFSGCDTEGAEVCWIVLEISESGPDDRY